MKKYKLATYMRIEQDEPELFDTMEEAQAAVAHYEAMNIDGMNLFSIEEVL